MSDSLTEVRAMPIALGVGLFGVVVTVAVIAKHGLDADLLLTLPFLLPIRLLPYVELAFAAFLLDRVFPARARLPMVLASTVLVAVDAIVSYQMFWQPQSRSTGGVAGVIAMLALVLVLIPGAIVVGYLLTGRGASKSV